MCYFHVVLNARKGAPPQLIHAVSADVKDLHMSLSEEDFNNLWSKIKSKWSSVSPQFVR